MAPAARLAISASHRFHGLPFRETWTASLPCIGLGLAPIEMLWHACALCSARVGGSCVHYRTPSAKHPFDAPENAL